MDSEKRASINITDAPQDGVTTSKLPPLSIQDETGPLAAQALTTTPLAPSASAAVLSKIDTHILPLLCITYALQFIDKTALGYASIYGLLADTHLVNQDYAWTSSIFYLGYLLAALPAVALLQRAPLAKTLGASIVAWGVVLAASAACESFAGIAVCRGLLGVLEAVVSPGFVAVTGMWWTRAEQAGRSALWISFLGVGSFVGVLVAYGIGHITSGPLAPWRYMFLVLGSVTVAWGVVFVVLMPDGPAGVRWLSEAERVVAVQRIAENKTGTKSRRFEGAQVWEAVRDPAVGILGLVSFVNAIASGGLAFGSLIIQGLGFSSINTTLMNLPLSTVQIMAQLGCGYLASRMKNSRLHLASLAMIPPVRLPQSPLWSTDVLANSFPDHRHLPRQPARPNQQMGPPRRRLAPGLVPRRLHGDPGPPVRQHRRQHQAIRGLGLGLCVLLRRPDFGPAVLQKHAGAVVSQWDCGHAVWVCLESCA